MNKNNVRIWLDKGFLHGEWSDRAMDDDERHLGIIIEVKVEAEEDNRESRKRLMVEMYAAFDKWLLDTGRK